MSDEPRTGRTKTALRLFGVAALAALFLAGARDEPGPESPFQRAARRLRVGMSIKQSLAVMNIGRPNAGSGSPMRYWDCLWFNHERRETLILHFDIDSDLLGDRWTDRLTEWKIESE